MKTQSKPDINPSETQSKPYGNLGVQSEKTCPNLAVLLKNLTALIFVWLLAVLVIASCSNNAYASHIQQKAVGLALAGYELSNGVQPTLTSGFFVRSISMRSHISMAKLERDTFKCAGIRLSLSANPFPFCHPHLAVNGKTSLNSNGVH